MNPQQLQAQAQTAANQGNQQVNTDLATSAQAGGQYQAEHAGANNANQNLASYADYMRGPGSATNLYTTGMGNAETAEGFDPASLSTATGNLIKSQNALSALNSASQSSTGGYGLSGAQLGGYYASSAQPLAGQVTAQTNAVSGLQQLYQNALTQAQQYAGVGVQGEQATSSALSQVFANAQSQAAQSQQQMQYYSNLASTQGGLNAQEQANYDAARASYAASVNSMAQAGLATSQTQGQNLANTAAQQRAAYTLVPDGHGGFNYSYNGTPITVQQYDAGTGNTLQPTAASLVGPYAPGYNGGNFRV